MKYKIDLEKAAEGEIFGALAVGRSLEHRQEGAFREGFTSGQKKVVSDLARSLVEIARSAGAAHDRVVVGDVSFELQGQGKDEILSVHAAVAS